MQKHTYSREEVIALIDNLMEHADVVDSAIHSENPTHDAEEMLELSESTIDPTRLSSGAKTLHNTTASQAKDNVKDIVFWGDGNLFKLIGKASSQSEGWMKSTKAMAIEGIGCLVQVTTQQGNNVAEALTFVPGAKIEEVKDGDTVISRKLIC